MDEWNETNKPRLGREEWAKALSYADDSRRPSMIDIIQYTNDQSDKAVTGKQLSEHFGVGVGAINAELVRFGRAVVTGIGVEEQVRENGAKRYWNIPFLNDRNRQANDNSAFYWTLRPEVVEALGSVDSPEHKIAAIVDNYVDYATCDIEKHVQAEKYKFDALRHFQNTFDLESDDLASNLKDALSKVGNLAVGAGYYPVASIYDITSNQPEEVRSALRLLFSDEEDEAERFSKFQEVMAPLSQQYSSKTVAYPYSMDLRFMSLLLSLYSPSRWINFKPTQVDAIYSRVYGEKTGSRANDAERVIKARDLGLKILGELNQRPEFADIRRAMDYGDDTDNLWFAQDVIWQSARTESTGLEKLTAKVQRYVQTNPDWRNNDRWPLTSDQIAEATKNFREKFSPEKLIQMSDEEILRWIPYREESSNDSLSYMLEFSPIIGKMGGIGGGSAGKMGYYQGKDGQWKKFQSNKVTTREDVLLYRKADIEVLLQMHGYISDDDYVGLKDYTDSLAQAAKADEANGIPFADSLSRYKAVLPALVWVRKYFTVLFPDKFLEVYAGKFVNNLTKIAEMDDIEGEKTSDYSLWYKQMNKISVIARKLNITNYELSKILWELINQTVKEEIQTVDSQAVSAPSMPAPKFNLNTIFYGPPGTGKTYKALHEYAPELLSQQSAQGRSKLEVLADQIKELTWWQVAALGLYHGGGYMKVADLAGTNLLQSYATYVKNRTTNIKPTLWTTLQERSDEASSSVKSKRDGIEYFNKNSNSEWSLTEEGRSYVEEALSDMELGVEAESRTDWKKFYRTITFHQSYSYEEFVEGIRPVVDPDADDVGMQFTIKDGIFKEMCSIAARDPENNYLLVIDEINRGNISKIFGELITLLEADKRSSTDSEGIVVRLPYSQELFSVPSNLYVLGTMNTADRSIALLDIALRRRFNFVEIMPEPSLLSTDVDGVNLQYLLTAINAKIEVMLDRDHAIGHSYLHEVSSLDELHDIWYNRIIPLLQEYFYNDFERLAVILGKASGASGFVELKSEADLIKMFGNDSEYTDAVVGSIKSYSPDKLATALRAIYEPEAAA